MTEITSIYLDRSVLDERHIPKNILFRKEQTDAITFSLHWAINNKPSTPKHMLGIGPSGTGKTLLIVKLIQDLKQQGGSKINIGYVLCEQTQPKTMALLADNMSIYYYGKKSFPFKGMTFRDIWNVVQSRLHNKITILVFDEIEKIIQNNTSEILYHLSRQPQVCIIGISNKTNVYETIKDQATLSSYKPQRIHFSSYNAIELNGILEDRAKFAFTQKANEYIFGKKSQFNAISKITSEVASREGDARHALDLLQTSADIAVGNNQSSITEEDVKRAIDDVERTFVEKSIMELANTQKLLLYCVMVKPNGKLGEIYNDYNSYAKQIICCDTLKQRRQSEYMSRLEKYRFIDITRSGKGFGKGTDWRVSITADLDKDILSKVISDWFKYNATGYSYSLEQTTLENRLESSDQ